MKKVGIFALAALFGFVSISCDSTAAENNNNNGDTVRVDAKSTNPSPEDHKVIVLDEAAFKEKVWNYEANPDEWEFKGDIPAVVDFYADWCGPCKKVAPIMEKLAKEYDGKIIIYKVNTDHNRELSSVFGIRSIPSILYIPLAGQPAMEAGAKSEAQYKATFEDFLLGNKKEEEKK